MSRADPYVTYVKAGKVAQPLRTASPTGTSMRESLLVLVFDLIFTTPGETRQRRLYAYGQSRIDLNVSRKSYDYILFQTLIWIV